MSELGGFFSLAGIIRSVERLLSERGEKGYLVGGFVRDMLLARATNDVDFAIEGDAVIAARQLSDRLGHSFVMLDEERGTARVVIRPVGAGNAVAEPGAGTGPRSYYLDFAALRAPSIEMDLALRDFTVNSMAVPLHHAGALLSGSDAAVIDPTGGRRDLAARIIRTAYDGAFQDDPIRLLRALRLAGEMSFSLDAATEASAHRDAGLLATPSRERVRDELMRILDLPAAVDMIGRLDELGLLLTALPELARTGQPALRHALATIRETEQLIGGARLQALSSSEYDGAPGHTGDGAAMDAEIQRMAVRGPGGYSIIAVLKLAALLHVLPQAGDANRSAARLRLSATEVKLARVAARSEGIVWTATAAQPRDLGLYRYFRETGEAGIPALLFAQAHAVTQGRYAASSVRRFAEDAITGYRERHATVVAPAPLISGDDILSVFGLQEGPLVGRVLHAVLEAQVAGKIASRQEALDLSEDLIHGYHA